MVMLNYFHNVCFTGGQIFYSTERWPKT